LQCAPLELTAVDVTENPVGHPNAFPCRLDWVHSLNLNSNGTPESAIIEITDVALAPAEAILFIAGVLENGQSSMKLTDGDKSDTEVLDCENSRCRFLAKYDMAASSTLQWFRYDLGDFDDVKLTVDRNGDAIIAGTFTGEVMSGNVAGVEAHSSKNKNILMTKYFSDGTHAWTRQIGGKGVERVEVIRPTEDGFVLGGLFQGQVDFGGQGDVADLLKSSGKSDVFVAWYHPNGELHAVRSFGGSGADTLEDMAVYQATGSTVKDALVMIGTYESDLQWTDVNKSSFRVDAIGKKDFYIVQYLPNSKIDWLITIGGPKDDMGSSMSITPLDEILFTIQFGFGDWVVYQHNGTFVGYYDKNENQVLFRLNAAGEIIDSNTLEAGKINDIASGKDDSLFVAATAQEINSEMATTPNNGVEGMGIALSGPGKKKYNRNTVYVATEVHGDSGPFILANEESLFLIGNIFGKAILDFQTSSEHVIGVDNVYSFFVAAYKQ
ncbi:MAG: hypothetical protein JXR76_18500, partial [Deltaproteobacteria bacterium]|nr:hypothetical protein [Deltaproteobacteria bacterium]